MPINKGMNISSVLNKSGKFGRVGARFAKTLFGPEVGGDAIKPDPIGGHLSTDHTVTISEFKSRTMAAFARPGLFLVSITPPEGFGITKAMDADVKVLNLNCYNAQIPGISLATTDKDIGYRSVAYQKLYDDVLLSFYCRETFEELKFMQDWMELISNPVTNRFEYYQNYVTTINIINLDKRNKRTLMTTLHEAYPKKVDPMQLDYGSNDIMRMTVSFTYRYFSQTYGDGVEPVDLSMLARRSDSKDNSVINELDPVFLGGGTSDESDIETF